MKLPRRNFLYLAPNEARECRDDNGRHRSNAHCFKWTNHHRHYCLAVDSERSAFRGGT
jgi:hypothetical protein